MYKIVYKPDLSTPQVVLEKEFSNYRSAMYFATKFQADGIVLEIKWYPEDKE